MKRKKYRDWLWILSIAIFLICTLEGVFWYRWIALVSEDGVLRFLCYVQNGIKAFKLDPDIKLKEIWQRPSPRLLLAGSGPTVIFMRLQWSWRPSAQWQH